MRTDVDRIASAPPPQEVRRGCIGGLFHSLLFALNPAPTPRKRLYGMELVSNWIPIGIAAFLWFTAWTSEHPMLVFTAFVGTILLVRNTK